MIVDIRILEVVGKFRSWVRGEGLLLRGEIDGESHLPVKVYLREFPAGVIEQFMIGEELSCMLSSRGSDCRAEVLPFDNQPLPVVSTLSSTLINMANQVGVGDIQKFRELSSTEVSGPLPPVPHPKTEELEVLLRLNIEDPEEGSH